MRQKTVIKNLLRSVAEVCYKVCQVLQSASGITKCDRLLITSASGITKCDRLLLQSALDITKCDSYYKVRRNTFVSYVSACLRAFVFYVPTCLCVLCAYVPACLLPFTKLRVSVAKGLFI